MTGQFQMSEADLGGLAGLLVDEAERQAQARGGHVTVYFRDGVSFPVTANFDPQRVCVAVTNGVVTDATIG